MHPTREEWQYSNCGIEIHYQYKGDIRNLLILDFMIDPLLILLMNIYGPNTNVPIYTQLKKQIENKHFYQYIIIGSDFDLVL